MDEERTGAETTIAIDIKLLRGLVGAPSCAPVIAGLAHCTNGQNLGGGYK